MHKTCKKIGIAQRNHCLGWLLLTPALLAFGVSYLLPFAIALVRSFFRGMGGEFAGLENYADLLRNQTFQLALRNLLLLWCFVLPLNLVAGFLLALLCHRAPWQKHRLLFFLPAVLPAAATVSIVYDCLGSFSAEGRLPFGGTGWANGPAAGFVFALLVLWKGLGYTVLVLTAALSSLPVEYTQAAQVEGAAFGAIVRRIYLPLLRPAFALCALLAVYNAFRCFREALMLGGTHPTGSLYSLQHFLQNNFTNMNFARLEAACVLLIAVPALAGVALLAQMTRQRRRKEG